ncbi:MAG: hypothetical protein WKF47_01355 [Geodermatophilaceae bacterium]
MINGSERLELPGFESLPAVSSTRTWLTAKTRSPSRCCSRWAGCWPTCTTPIPDLQRAQDDLAELLEEQRQLLGDFQPTPQDEIAELDPDPYDLARRTATPPGEPDLFTGSFDLPAYLHLSIDPRVEAELLPDNGFVGLYNRSSYDAATGADYQFQTYEFGSSAQADAVLAEFDRIEQQEFPDRVTFTVPEDPTDLVLLHSGQSRRWSGVSTLLQPGWALSRTDRRVRGHRPCGHHGSERLRPGADSADGRPVTGAWAGAPAPALPGLRTAGIVVGWRTSHRNRCSRVRDRV